MNTSVMELALSSKGDHSAQVIMRLLVNALFLAVAQMGAHLVLVDAPVNHGPAVIKAHRLQPVRKSIACSGRDNFTGTQIH